MHSFICFPSPKGWSIRSQGSEMFPANRHNTRYASSQSTPFRAEPKRTHRFLLRIFTAFSKNIYFSASKPRTYASPFFTVSGWRDPTSLYILCRFTSPGKTGIIHTFSAPHISVPFFGVIYSIKVF